MSRRKQETLEELEAREAAEQDRLTEQQNCNHWGCRPSAWHWSGQIREMTCDDCGLVDYREET